MTSINSCVRISVVIPAYNAARFLPRCLESVFLQTLKPYEVIVVDDGSTDNSAAIAKASGARVISRSNGGISAARNTGILNASGDWIALLDADDFWDQEKLERQASLIRSKTVLVYSGIRFFGDNRYLNPRPAVDPGLARKMLRYRNPITPSTVLVKREIVMKVGGFREDICACEDWELWVRLLHFGEFEAVTDPLTSYYINPNGVSASPEIMLLALDQIIDTTLLADLHGFSRLVWRQRIRAVQLYKAALIARDNRIKGDLRYLFVSLFAWPSPFWEPIRFIMFAVSLRNSLLRKRKRDESGI